MEVGSLAKLASHFTPDSSTIGGDMGASGGEGENV
jgi:hypothetical protein